MEKQALTFKDITMRGGGCRSTLYKAIAAGKLKARKRGRSTIVLAPDFAEYLENLPHFETKEAA